MKNNKDDLALRKKRTHEFSLGESLAVGIQALNDEPSTTTFDTKPVSMGQEDMVIPGIELSQQSQSPLNTILERYANFEKVLFQMKFRKVIILYISNTAITNFFIH